MQFSIAHQPQFGIQYSEILKPGRNPVRFSIDGVRLAGNIYTPVAGEFDSYAATGALNIPLQ